ncbi:MAG: hypothetical protein ABFD90_02280 [Phycisphaerales bacterium]
MSSIWVKIAGVAVAAVVVIVVLGRLGGDKPVSEPVEKDKTFYDMADRDKQFNEEPKPVEQPPAEPAQQPAAEAQAQPEQPAPVPAQEPAAQVPGVVLPSSITQATTLYFKPLSEEDDIAAQQLLPYATAGRSIGRLPVVQYGLMMKAVGQIEQRWPDSWYCFRAKQMMEEIAQYSDRNAQTYKITPERLDITKFLKPRQGTEPRTVEPVR